ncbi:MAG: hypothetical protein Q7S44_00005 [bacterium]|nr:hypothetical protein [bacterium]
MSIEQGNGEFGDRETDFSHESFRKYVEGCTEVALGLHSVVENIRAKGKKPVILIPSRGAVPIFLLAHQALKGLDPNHFLLDPNKVDYYPSGIFELLSRNSIAQSAFSKSLGGDSGGPGADVILYPFTADISLETKGEEWLARRLRESCAKAFCELVFKGNEYPEDLAWYYFLMGKMREDPQDPPSLRPKNIVSDLKNYKKGDGAEIVLIDTVISGRAARDIVSSFAALNCKVTPILAVDTRGGSRFQASKKAEIEATMEWEYIGEQTPFKEFPLITEDKGAALLGVSAINFGNFNQPGFFRSADKRFKNDFLPQSCVWDLPPNALRSFYLDLFYNFLDICREEAVDQHTTDLIAFEEKLKPFLGRVGDVSESEIKKIVKLKQSSTGKESASHIVSVTLTPEEAREWVKDFAEDLFEPKRPK